MRDLLRADFYRIKKDLMLIISLIVLVFFAITTPGTYLLLKQVAPGEIAELEALGMAMNAKAILVSSISIGNNFGLILPILIGIMVCRDFSTGTVRNKIIAGHKKSSIYLSHLITATMIGVALFALYALLTLALGCLFLGYGSEFNSTEFLYVLKVLLMGAFQFAILLSIVVFLSALTKSVGLVIVLQIGAAIVISILGSLPTMLREAPEWLITISKLNPTYQTMLASGGVDGELMAWTLISASAYIAVLYTAGVIIYRRADQK